MAATIYEVLDELRESSTSEADKGSKLEQLIAAYLRTDPVYAEQFSEVWTWQQWPGRRGKHDTGIDLVAKDRRTGGLVAIQCKFFAPNSTVSKPDIDSFLSASGKAEFTERIIVSTTDRWNANAEDAIQGQQIPVRRIGMADLEASPVDWFKFSLTRPGVLVTTAKKKLRPHQSEAINDVVEGFARHDRGKLVMACGTGKTFTALRLAEQLVGAGGSVLFLVPSISLLSQTLREWSVEATVSLAPLAVCSDRKSTVRSQTTNEDISAVDLALPATTNIAVLESRLTQALGDTASMTVLFATYQSINVVAEAQRGGQLPPFDLIICDEAHRTTGTTLAGEDESAFVRIHDNGYVAGRKRLYMTATPRIYDDSSRAKAGEANAVLTSMDDEITFGPEFHRLGFGEAVSRDLLTDYKVLVLAVDETAIAKTFQVQLAEDGELKLDDAAKIVGCWNGLAKRGNSEHPFDSDPIPMRRAVAFAGTIKDSTTIEGLFSGIVAHYAAAHDLDGPGNHGGTAEDAGYLQCEVKHVDGSFNALERNTRLDWLRAKAPDGQCRILTNARCLSEGVDVPSLDAVMFLSPRKSVVDIVQSVGRVMRKSDGKRYGYIILPIGIPHGLTPEQALKDNKRYAAVWEVLQALRAHDERFDAMINRIDLTSSRDTKINVIGVGGPFEHDTERTDGAKGVQETLALSFAGLDEWRDAIYAKVVTKVGSRRYWETWAKDVADIANRHVTRITALLDGGDPKVSAEFDQFLEGLRGNLNDGVTRADAVDMLAQHLITRPVFDALFAGYDFAAHNPVAQTMDRMLAALDEHALDDENATLAKFYESVRVRVAGVDSAEGRQKIIVQLYDTFFATAFKKTVDKLGIVYTPVEIVDFILRSADWALRNTFGKGLTDEGVHILDGFAGTGTFMVRLLQSGLIKPHDLARKYAHELHANEILLLAYYIAAANIETAYQDAMRANASNAQDVPHEPFPGLVLTDTFQSYEGDDEDDLGVFPDNNERIIRQRALPITVIVGNPPYSAGQDNANQNNQNERYRTLDASIRETYAARSDATSLRTLYDSYIRAIRWATLRIKDRGVVAYVTNGGFLDSNAAAGMRKTLADEFSAIHIFNLRGNRRTAQAEGRPIFEEGRKGTGGSITTIAVIVLVKDRTQSAPTVVRYDQVGDNLTARQKLAAVSKIGSVSNLESPILITPNEYGDWLNQRSDEFSTFLPIGSKDSIQRGIFATYSLGVATGRDAWAYGSSTSRVGANMSAMIAEYERLLIASQKATTAGAEFRPDLDPTRISWNRNLDNDLRQGKRHQFRVDAIRDSCYRPFFRQKLYFDRGMNGMIYQLPRLFPSSGHPNHGIVITGVSSHYEFSFLMADQIPDLHALDTGQFFPRWTYEPVEDDAALFSTADGEIVDGFRRVDNITDEALAQFRTAYGPSVSKDDIFYYLYGLFHSPDYRTTYAADLKKMLPRVPLVTDAAPFIDAGRRLSAMHLAYEAAAPYPLDGLDGGPREISEATYEHYRVQKMRFGGAGKARDRTTIICNSQITLSGVPEDAYRYMLGPRSAIEWVMDRYQVKVDKASQIKNDPNDWSREVGNPRYIIDLVARIVTVSLHTMAIIDDLPALKLRPQPS